MNYLYNGVELPALPEWDKETYPYADIEIHVQGEVYFSVLSSPLIAAPQTNPTDGSIIIYTSTPDDLLYYCEWTLTNGEWANKTESTTGDRRLDSDYWAVRWTNTDILYEDGTLYLAASDPVPVLTLTPSALLTGFQHGVRVRLMRTSTYPAAGLYETGTNTLIYSWDQLLGDEILEGGVVHVTDGVLTTGFTSFANESADTLAGDLVIPKGVTTLGYNCFYKCDNLTAVTIPEGVTLIEGAAFMYCECLKKVNIPKSVIHIGVEGFAFYGCSALEEVHITDLTAWCLINFYNSTDTPLCCGTTVLYLNGLPLTDLVIPEGISAIKPYAFSSVVDNVNFKSVSIPDSVTAIGKYAFSGCTALATVTGGANVASVEAHAFDGCPCVSTDQQGLKTVQTWVVGYEGEVTEITIPNTVTVIGGSVFSNCDTLTSVAIPNSVISIGVNAFTSCDALTSVTIPDSVIDIGVRAFGACRALSEVIISDNVTAIRNFTFINCVSLTNITIPSGVTEIGYQAFYKCSVLGTIVFEGTVEQWNAITFGEEWNTDVPATEVICSDGTVIL